LAAAGQPLRLGLIVLALAASGALGAWTWRGGGGLPRVLLSGEAGALALLLLSALTLRDAQWPAMAGAWGLLAAHGLAASRARRPSVTARPLEILCWVLSYLGQAAMAYVFLR
jgi:hypothetical protein